MPGLGRLVEFDERSKDFPIRPLLARRATKKRRSYTWRVDVWLNQGESYACTGFSWAHEFAARPVVVRGVDSSLAYSIYGRNQQLDEWAPAPHDGSSVLAGAKTAKEMGHLDEYRWAFGLDDLILAIGYHGPAVLGIDWYDGMFDPDERGFISPTGGIAGGHAILAHAVNIREEYVTLWNSWGSEWGDAGRCRIRFSDLDALLRANGEACIPVRRK